MVLLPVFTKPKHGFIESRRDAQQGLAFPLALRSWRVWGGRVEDQRAVRRGENSHPAKFCGLQWHRVAIASLHWRLPCDIIPPITSTKPQLWEFLWPQFVWETSLGPSPWMVGNLLPALGHLPGAISGLAGSPPSPRCSCLTGLISALFFHFSGL